MTAIRMPKWTLTAGLLLAATYLFAPLAPAPALAAKVLTMPVGASAQGNADLGNLDPRTFLSTDHAAVQTAFLDSLVRVYKNEVVPAAAESWEVSDDGITYTFHLRDAKWSDGVPVTADDFVQAFVRMFQIAPASAIYDDILNGAELRAGTATPDDLGVKAPDDKTVVITLRAPAPYFLGLISSHFAAPGRADLVEKFGDAYGADVASLPSNGPFILTEWSHGDRIVLKKNPDYWNADAIKLDEVDFLVVPNESTKRNMFDNGDLDIFIPVTEDEVAAYDEAGVLLRYEKGGVRDVQINRHGQGDPIKAKLLSDPNFMKAISYAFDRQGFVDNVLKGNAIPATVQTPAATSVSGLQGKTWGDVSPNFGVYHPTAADTAKSKEYLAVALANAGLSSVDEVPELDLLTSQDPQDPKVVTPYLLSVLADMGLKVNLVQATGNQFYNYLYKPALEYDLAVAGWGPDFDDPITYMGYWNSGSMDMGVTYENADFDKLLIDANLQTDPEKRAAILVDAEAMFSDNGPCIPLLHWKGNVAIAPRVTGVVTSTFLVAINYLYADIVE
jgi:oligopeptide transport system substrate-binding protein